LPFGGRPSLVGPSCTRCGIAPSFRRSSGLLDRGPDHNGVAAFRATEKRSGRVLPVLRGLGCPRTRSGADLAAGQEFISWMLTHYRRKRINHRFRRPSLTKPHQKFTCVHPSDLPLARNAWMVQTRLGLHPSAFACFVTWHLQGSGTGLDTGQEHDHTPCSLMLVRHRVANRVEFGCRHPNPPSEPC
jgi:hypothetical protein